MTFAGAAVWTGRCIAALVLAATFVEIARIGGRLVAGRRGVLLDWAAAIALLLWVPTLCFHALIAARMFSLAPALALALLSGAAAFRFGGGRVGFRHRNARDRR